MPVRSAKRRASPAQNIATKRSRRTPPTTSTDDISKKPSDSSKSLSTHRQNSGTGRRPEKRTKAREAISKAKDPARSRADQKATQAMPLGPDPILSLQAWGEIPVQSTKLLSPAQERELVSVLSTLRAQLIGPLRELSVQATPGTKLDHFDQIVCWYIHARDGRTLKAGPSSLREIENKLREYNRVKQQLVMANLAWVTKLARSHRHRTISKDDLFQEGVCGLLRAIDRFEAERGLRLMTYATWYIREAMQQVRARQTHLVALSSHDQTLLGRMETSKAAFAHDHDRLPTAKELGQSVERSAEAISRLQRAVSPPLSLERGGIEGTVPIAIDDPAHEFDRNEEVHCAVTRLLATLPLRERAIVTRRFGLDGNDPVSLEELGGSLQVSKERIRQLQRQAIKRMQAQAQTKPGLLV